MTQSGGKAIAGAPVETVDADIQLRASMVLLLATAAALIVANTSLAGVYKSTLYTEVPLGFATDTVKGWIKNGLMAGFFLFVGLEIKAEFAEGALSDRDRAILPFVGAAGGMAAPALVYLLLASGNPAYVAGWAIPSATDIAFAIGVVGLLGSRVPPALKAFLLAVAVIDDLGAILIIALFYSGSLSLLPLLGAAIVIGALYELNRRDIDRLALYLGLGVLLWLLVLKSGINPTLAGVITALFVPMTGSGAQPRPVSVLIKKLKYPVLFGIMPLFAFANAGVVLTGLRMGDLVHPVTSGVALGLLIGKPVGITLAVWACVRSGYARLPSGSDWASMFAISCIAGIGFTMSLFIGTLGFNDGPLLDQVRLGVLIGSLVSALVGVALLMMRPRQPA